MFQGKGEDVYFCAEVIQPVSLIYAFCIRLSHIWGCDTWCDPSSTSLDPLLPLSSLFDLTCLYNSKPESNCLNTKCDLWFCLTHDNGDP